MFADACSVRVFGAFLFKRVWVRKSFIKGSQIPALSPSVGGDCVQTAVHEPTLVRAPHIQNAPPRFLYQAVSFASKGWEGHSPNSAARLENSERVGSCFCGLWHGLRHF